MLNMASFSGLTITILYLNILKVKSLEDLSGCPDQLQSQQYARAYTDTCILFVHDEKSWDDSRKLCRNMGGDLVMLKDSQKEKFFLSTMNALRWDRNQIWIGLTDSHHEGHWQWVDGTPIDYGNFARGQGNNHAGGFLFFGGSSEDCALLRRDDGGLWHDYPCHPPIDDIGYHYSYACEFPRQISAVHPTHSTSPLNGDTTRPTTEPSTAVAQESIDVNLPSTWTIVPPGTDDQHTSKGPLHTSCEDNKFVNCKDPDICKSVFKKDCPVTCSLCVPCVDNHFINCAIEGVCDSAYRQYCRKTCAICRP